MQICPRLTCGGPRLLAVWICFVVIFCLTCFVLAPATILLWLSTGNQTFNPHPGEWWAVNIPLGIELNLCQEFWIYSISLGTSAGAFFLSRRYVGACVALAMAVSTVYLQLHEFWFAISVIWTVVAFGVVCDIVTQSIRRSATHGFEVLSSDAPSLRMRPLSPQAPPELRPSYGDRPRFKSH